MITNIIGKNWEDRSNHRNYVAIALSDRYHIPDVRTFANSTLVNELRDLPKTILTGIPHKYIEIIKQDLEETWCVLRIEEFDGEENTKIDYDAVIKRVERIKAKNRCPRCSSENITTGSRGYSMLWGFLGSGSTVNRCGNCGHTWKP